MNRTIAVKGAIAVSATIGLMLGIALSIAAGTVRVAVNYFDYFGRAVACEAKIETLSEMGKRIMPQQLKGN